MSSEICYISLKSNCIFLGSSIGQAMSEHPDIRKLGFTGSTPIGKTIMERYQSFVSLLFLLYFLFKGLRNEKKQNSASKLFFLFVYLWGEKNHASIC